MKNIRVNLFISVSFLLGRIYFEAIIGSVKWSMNMEPARANITTYGMKDMTCPIIPAINIIGKNAEIVVRSAEMTAVPTSEIPSFEASIGFSPFSK